MPLECHKCGKDFESIPKLKAHYEVEFEREKKRATTKVKR